MQRIDELTSKLFFETKKDELSHDAHSNMIVWWIDDLAKVIENIRETSLSREDARVRLSELSARSGITLGTLIRFYDKL